LAVAGTSTVDFFKSQDIARRKSSILVGYYFLAVALIILAVYLAVAAVFYGAMAKEGTEFSAKSLWNPDVFVWVTGVTALIVAIGSIYKISQLSSGGASVAQLLGGREIASNATDVNERKILNVVEEMSIASGVPVPRVFILEEEGINAFAAGFSTGDAVVGVTRGCITQLNRDELQGVVAHEFSHILNGDMRLNIRLIGVLNGILVISLIGYWIFRSTSRVRSKKGNALPIIMLGLLLWIIGYIGVFFGKLIKSAVSRQREFLADASSVQFTRNPAGIAGALKKIGSFAAGSRVSNEHAEEASHFFFSNGLAESFFNLMATHPPLEERIRRIDPTFAMEMHEKSMEAAAQVQAEGASGFAGGSGKINIRPAEVVASVGAPTSRHVKYASGLIAGLPEEVLSAVREPVGSRAVIYSLLVNKKQEHRDVQIKYLAGHAEYPVHAEVLRLLPVVDKMTVESRLPLVDMAVSALKKMSGGEYKMFQDNIQYLVSADKQVDLFEYALQKTLLRNLQSAYSRVKPPSVRYKDINELLPACGRLLSCLAYWGADEADVALKAFEKGMARLGNGVSIEMSPLDNCGLPMIDEVLNQAIEAAPMVRKQILDACVTCIGADGQVTIEEAELIRAVASSMDCPLPPLMAGRMN
jgi:Zn-dependent protease with chaperone function